MSLKQNLIFIFGLSFSINAMAEDDENTEEDSEETTPLISEEVDGDDRIDGLFPLYRNPKDGSTRMEIRAEQIDKEYVYFSQTVDGVLEASHFRGAYRKTEVLSIRKYYNRIEIVAENTQYYFDPESPLSRAQNANISPSVLLSLPIIAEEEDENGQLRYLVSADAIFLNEDIQQISPSPNPDYTGQRYQLGSLDSDKTKYHALKNYPSNTDVVVDYVYHNSQPTVYGSNAVTDARNTTIRIRHSLIEMPENNYIPRSDDFRVGYFMQSVDDMTSMSHTPYRDMINRWHLEPAKPKLALSPPKEPIVWWIENTTPYEFRESIKEGVLAWNTAFESAGFSNAMEVKVQPDDAEWDAGDIDYNVLRWTSSPQPPFGGYGPSFVNPRTGQILGADIMLELVYITNRVNYNALINPPPTEPASEPPFILDTDKYQCEHSMYLAEQMMLGQVLLDTQDASKIAHTRLLQEGIKHLVLHEVGHTLGLNHNMKASTNLPFEDLHNTEVTDKQGLAGSVMDYTPLNISPSDATQGKYFSDIPGAYDHWAIEYGYRPPLPDAEEEANRVETLLSRSREPLLTFGNDADDMRSPYNGIDPRVMVGDLSADPVAWATERAEIGNAIRDSLLEKHLETGESHQTLVDNFYITLGIKSGGARTVSNYIGGIYVERGMPYQFNDDEYPYQPVDFETQKAAMNYLSNEIFAPDAFVFSEELLASLQTQRRGFSFFWNTEDPKIHQTILSRQSRVLFNVLHPTTLDRITNSTLYGNTYTVHMVLKDLTDAIFWADILGNTTSIRRNLQLEYVEYLIGIAQNKEGQYDATAVSASQRQLKRILLMTRTRLLTVSGKETRRHRHFIHDYISNQLD